MQRIKFIARTFAETGVKALFLLVHAMTLKHARKEEIIKLRGQWVPVDPRQWVKRYDMAISVGLGAGDKTQQIVFLQNVLQIQQVAIQAGLTSPDKIYNTLKRLTQAAGFKNPDEFWNDPATTKPAPPAPHPEVLKEQAKAQAQAQIEAGKAQTTMEVEKMRGALKMQELQASLQLQASNDMRDSDREQMRAQMDAELKRQQIELDQWKARLQAEMDKYKADLDSATKLQIAGISQDTTISSTIMGNEHAYRQEALSAFKGLAEKDAEIMADAKPVVEVDGIKLAMAEVSRQMADIARQQQALDNRASQPAKIIRGPDGKAHAVDVGGVIRQVVRGPDGKIAALH
jgi:phosphotransferase system HPr-like phosphotransfer protein